MYNYVSGVGSQEVVLDQSFTSYVSDLLIPYNGAQIYLQVRTDVNGMYVTIDNL